MHDASDNQARLQQQLSELQASDTSGLRDTWRRLYRAEPPPVSRDLMIRALASRIQERAFGGLSKATERRLEALIKEFRPDSDVGGKARSAIRPGARLVREWHGRTHTVLVTEAGFEYAGTFFSSLITIARTITGARWSGPRFFGLRAKKSADGKAPVRQTPIGRGRAGSDEAARGQA